MVPRKDSRIRRTVSFRSGSCGARGRPSTGLREGGEANPPNIPNILHMERVRWVRWVRVEGLPTHTGFKGPAHGIVPAALRRPRVLPLFALDLLQEGLGNAPHSPILGPDYITPEPPPQGGKLGSREPAAVHAVPPQQVE